MISPGLVLKPVVSCRLRSSRPRCHWETTLDLVGSKNYCSPIIAIKQNSPAKRAFPYLLRNSLSENFDNILSNIIVKMPLWHWVCGYKLLQIFHRLCYRTDAPHIPPKHRVYIHWKIIQISVLAFSLSIFLSFERSGNDIFPSYNLFSWL